ncbi:MAG: baseplate J/gp47 family protein, partial [Desulfitobacteriaceae bacterium]|nr:baseplate J/gp47 family protein [Desulfitobacteriaceae bacterium]
AGVARALCRLTWQDSSIPDNTARVYIVPEGGGLPSQALKDAVIQELTQNKPMPPTMGLEVVDPLYKVVDIAGTIYVLPTADKAAIEAQKQAVLADLFSYTKRDENNAYVVDFGKPFYLSTIIAALRNIPGVYNVVLTAPTGDVVPAAAEIVALGDTSGLVVVQP